MILVRDWEGRNAPRILERRIDVHRVGWHGNRRAVTRDDHIARIVEAQRSRILGTPLLLDGIHRLDAAIIGDTVP
jgi:hypothetical protein